MSAHQAKNIHLVYCSKLLKYVLNGWLITTRGLPAPLASLAFEVAWCTDSGPPGYPNGVSLQRARNWCALLLRPKSEGLGLVGARWTRFRRLPCYFEKSNAAPTAGWSCLGFGCCNRLGNYGEMLASRQYCPVIYRNHRNWGRGCVDLR